MPRRKPPTIPDELLDQFLSGSDPRTALAEGGLLDGLKKALAERVLNAEMDHHLAGEAGAGNRRNGYGAKTVLTGSGALDLRVYREFRVWGRRVELKEPLHATPQTAFDPG